VVVAVEIIFKTLVAVHCELSTQVTHAHSHQLVQGICNEPIH